MSKTEPTAKIIARKYILIPEVKIKTAHEKTTNRVCPISGWVIRNSEMIVIKIVVNRYFERILNLLLQRMVAKVIIKKGFKTSIGWNLGKNNKSIHLFEPLTSTPIIGTKNKEKIDNRKRKIENLNNLSFLNDEKIKTIIIPIKT